MVADLPSRPTPATSQTSEAPSLRTQRLLSYLLPIVCLSAGYQFVRCYVSFPYFYLRLPQYFSGTERLPFQLRVLPILILKPLGRNHLIQRISAARFGPLHNPDRLAFFLLSLVSFAILCYFLVKLYRVLSPSRRLEFLLFPTFFFILTWTYILHIEQNFSYPYDLPSLAFFTAGLYYIYLRRFLPLVVILAIGTFNRETTLFLIGIYMLDAASIPSDRTAKWRARFDLSRISWTRVAYLAAIWLAIKLPLALIFRYNDRSEDYLRIHDNIIRLLKPFYWPAALNLGGYLLPFVLLFRRRILPQRFANYLYILGPWFLIIFCSGVILETRVYGELCGYLAVAVVLIFEQYIESLVEVARHPSHPVESTSDLVPDTL